MPELIVEPSEWVVIVHRHVYVVIRCVVIAGDEYWRVVTGDDDRSRRRLVGYWGSLEEASNNALAFVEHQLPPAWMATGTATFQRPRKMTAQKPLPGVTAEEHPWRAPRGVPRGVDIVWDARWRQRHGER